MTSRALALTRGLAASAWLLGALGCHPAGATDPFTPAAKPTYNPDTGRLERLDGDRDGDGKVDLQAEMDGLRFKKVAIDRDGDGRPDRWEYYDAPAAPAPGRVAPAAKSELVRAEEANGADRQRPTRREFYEHGVIVRIEEDTDADGRTDTWDWYEHGALARMEIDLQGRGRPDRRLVYGPAGDVERVEVDAKGDGVFVPLPRSSPAAKDGAR
jgi:hypothetical protein